MKSVLWLFLLILSFSAIARAEEWQSDLKNSHLDFEASYEKQPIKGTFPTFDCRLHVDKTSPDNNKLDVTVAVSKADMFNADINDAIKTATWFDVIHFPQAEFHSQHIKQIDATHFLAQGVLQIKNSKKQIELPFEWSANKLAGAATLKRTDFDIGIGDWASDAEIGYDVKVTFAVNLINAKQ